MKHGYKNDTSPCIFMKRYRNDFIITAVYVEDLSIIGTPEELPKAINYLKEEFEMKDLGRTKFCIGLQIEHLKMIFSIEMKDLNFASRKLYCKSAEIIL